MLKSVERVIRTKGSVTARDVAQELGISQDFAMMMLSQLKALKIIHDEDCTSSCSSKSGGCNGCTFTKEKKFSLITDRHSA
ncbi:FeoC-like transcriptional regulator [Polycladidibacter stylochi]|uniref:FeoC-like transcriptional regulator n=1 Tax=Polycladidibacter stylochi TaxID=1807766 RepID=UPI0009EC7D6E|nr:FeoC-like transcriptional regulator [Pseudovibrio stylochi]